MNKMLSEKDLIYLGACIFLNKEHWTPLSEEDRHSAIECSKKLFDEIFQNEGENMILE